MGQHFRIGRGLALLISSAGFLLIMGLTSACGSAAPMPAPSAPAPAAGAATGAAPAAQDWDRKIIRNATLNLVVANVETSLAAIRDLATGAGGFVSGSSSQAQDDGSTASVTIQVPVAAFDDVMTHLRKLAQKVSNETSTSQDVTEEYTDLGSEIKNLQVQEDQLRAIMGRATTIDETLRVQTELGNVQGAIEKAQGRLNYLSRRSDLSTITVNLVPPPVPAATPGATWAPDAAAGRAWTASMRVLAKASEDVITLVVFYWWIFPLLGLCVLVLRSLGLRLRSPGPRVS